MARANLSLGNPLTINSNLASTMILKSPADPNPLADPMPSGKTVVITGGANRVGQAIAISFAVAGAARIALVDNVDASITRSLALQAAEDVDRLAPDIIVLEINASDAASVGAGVAEISSRWKSIDILVNNTGDLSPCTYQLHSLGMTEMEKWWRMWEINVKGAYVIVQALLPLLLQATEKTIVNVAPFGCLALTPGTTAYQLSELALMCLFKCLTVDHARNGLLAYTVHPPHDFVREVLEPAGKAVYLDQPGVKLAADTVVYLTHRRREWLAERHINCAWDMRKLLARKDEIVQKDLFKLNMSFGDAPTRNEMYMLPHGIRGRVSRSSY